MLQFQQSILKFLPIDLEIVLHQRITQKQFFLVPPYNFVANIFIVIPLLLENMWSDYQQKGEISEKAGLQSVDARGATENFGMYVSADIATSFTLLVGIFFPSATGKQLV